MWCCGWVMRTLCVTEGLQALVHCWVSGAAQVCVSLLGPSREPAAVIVAWSRVGVVLCENCIVDASIFLFCVLVLFTLIVCVSVCFVTGVWWMPWHAEPMKDV